MFKLIACFLIPDNCPADYSYSRKANICIKVFTTGSPEKDLVQQICEDDAVGGGLVTIRNQDQQDFVENEIKRQPSSKIFRQLFPVTEQKHRDVYIVISYISSLISINEITTITKLKQLIETFLIKTTL